jgi:uncharacterized cupin superfamily protein
MKRQEVDLEERRWLHYSGGFKGTGETVEKVRKHYVILMPKGK